MISKISKISTYDSSRGYGFIENVVSESESNRRRIFFHVHDWHGNVAPEPGMVVHFELGPSRKPGMADVAVNIIPMAEILFAATKESGVGGDK
jgi:cold shock CspA family protein